MISLEWVKHLPEENKEEFIKIIKASTTMKDRLTEIVEERLSSIDTQEMSESDFDAPNWAEKQAFRNGRKSELRKLLQLLKF